MLVERFLESVTTSGKARSVKVYNTHCYTALAYQPPYAMVELPSAMMLDIPVLADSFSNIQLDNMLLQLIKQAARVNSFSLLDPSAINWEKHLKDALTDLRKSSGQKVQKFALLATQTAQLENLVLKFTKRYDYIELIPCAEMGTDVALVPLSFKIGTLVRLQGNKEKMGMALYENCVKRLTLYSDNDLSRILEQITDAFKGDL